MAHIGASGLREREFIVFNSNILPVYEKKEVINSLSEKYVVVTINGKSVELRKKYAGDTFGVNGSLSVLGQDGLVKKSFMHNFIP